MSGTIIEARLVVLPGHVWQSELTTELERLGVSPERAPAVAAHALHRIVGHHGWPKEVIRVARSDGDEPIDLEVTGEESSKPKRSHAASRRRTEAAK